jgi:CRP/FNR family transcriptional regulator, anaerobic regulatory protein
VIQATHQQMAAELGTAREVVSRQLSEFQRREWVAQSRGEIRILNRAAIEDLAGKDR